jgi:hypothetical protein
MVSSGTNGRSISVDGQPWRAVRTSSPELDRRIHERRLSADGAVPMPLTQEEIADCTGLTPPYVNRMLQMLRQKGLIRFESKVLEILDRVELAKIAGFDPYYIEGWGKGGSRLGSN